jgi:type I restriction enzyme S subunit
VPSIRKSTLTAIPFPLPPLEEQKRIVRTLDGLVKKLEAERRRLLEAEEALGLLERSILDRAFRGKLGTAGEKDEPIVLLVKKTFSPSRK